MVPKIRIEVDPELRDGTEIIIRTDRLDDEVLRLQQVIETNYLQSGGEMVLQLGDAEYLVPVKDILFFETEERMTAVHTADRILYTEKKLYQLEDILPKFFIRGSKSSILNLREVISTRRDFSGICEVGFRNTQKKAYVSRMYAKVFLEKLTEMRLNVK